MRGRLLTVLAVFAAIQLVSAVPAGAETAWTPVTPAPPVPGDVTGAGLFDVSAVSPTDVWAVGNGWTDVEQPLIDHLTGAGWQSVAAPTMPDFQYSITAVDAVSARDVWVVGSGMAVPSTEFTAIAAIGHYDGTTWSLTRAPTLPGYAALNDVDALSARDGWAVGWQTPSLTEPVRPLVMRWRNGRWSTVSLPGLGTETAMLNHVSARAANDVWAVGSVGDNDLVMHFDGARWTRVPVPSAGGTGSFETLRSVAAVSASEAWAVGDSCVTVTDGTQCQPHILRLCGGVWRVVPSAGDHGTNLRDVVVRSPRDVWVVGYDLPPGGTESNHTEHWDGQRFTTVPTSAGVITPRGQLASALEAVTRAPGSAELWAVGWGTAGPQVIWHG